MERSHMAGKKHQHLAEVLQKQRLEAERTIFVKQTPHGVSPDLLRNYFQQFGPTNDIYVDKTKGFAFVEFRSRDSVFRVLSRPHVIHGFRLQVAQKVFKRRLPSKNYGAAATVFDHAVQVKLDHNHIADKLQQAKDVANQMQIFQEYVQLVEKDKQERLQVQAQLQQAIAKHIPGVTLHPFGSSGNGFGVRGCDIDIYVDLHLDEDKEEPKTKPNLPVPFIKDISCLKVVNGRVTKASLREASLIERAKFVGRILKQSKVCDTVFTVPSQRCPVARLVHMATGVKCDLTVNSGMAVRNTFLIRYLSSIDERFHLIMPTIRHWAKLMDLTGDASSGPHLTNYALVLLVVFYLQQGNTPVLPSIEQLAQLQESKQEIDGWDCSFPTDSAAWKHTVSTATADQLLRGFFQFYDGLDWSNSVLCLCSGKIEDLATFREAMNSDKQITDYKLGVMNVQDPFVLTHNTTHSINAKTLHKVQHRFRTAAARSVSTQFTDTSQPWGLMLLMSPDEYTEPPSNSPKAGRPIAAGASMDYSFNIAYIHAKLKDHFYATIMGENERKAMWVREACALYETFLQDVLLMQCDKILDTLDRLAAKFRGKSVSSNPDDSLQYCYTEDKDDCFEFVDLVTPKKKSVSANDVADKAPDSPVDRSGNNQESATDIGNNNISVVDLCDSTDASMLSIGDTTVDLSSSMHDDSRGNPELIDLSDSVEVTPVKEVPAIRALKRPSEEISEVAAKKARSEPSDIQCTPVRRTSPPAKPNQVLHIKCESKCRVWHGRKKARQQVRHKHPGLTDVLDIEIKVSDCQHEQQPSGDVVVARFETSVLFSDDILKIELQPKLAVKEFSNVFSFIQPLFTRIVEQSLYKS